jgi:hypothetical protein
MSVAEAPRSQGLIQRATNILLHPKAEWDVIAAEPATTQGLFIGYAAILAAVPALARIANGFMPHCLFGVCMTWNPVFIVVSAVVYYVISLAGVFVVGLIIDALAPGFGGQKNQVQAMKTAVYSWTAAWLAGIFIVVPWVGALFTLLGLYSFYLLYLAIPRTMKAPEQQSLAYTIVAIILGIVVFIVGGAIAGTVATMGAIGGAGVASNPAVGGTVHFGNGSSVDLDKLAAAGRQAEAQMKAQQEGGPNKIVAVDPERLKALLPDTVAGAPRTDASATSASAAGFGASNAEAVYQNGDARITLKITDLAAAGGFAAMASAINVQSSEQTATGYKKVSTVNGMLTTEKYDNEDRSGEYTVIVANRFAIEADGSKVDMDALKAAVAAVGPDRVAALAHG